MDTYLSLVAQVVPVLLLALIVEERMLGNFLAEQDLEELAYRRRYLERTVRLAVPVELLAVSFTFLIAFAGDELDVWMEVVLSITGLLSIWAVWRLLQALMNGLLRAIDAARPVSAVAHRDDGHVAPYQGVARLAVLGIVVAAVLGRKR